MNVTKTYLATLLNTLLQKAAEPHELLSKNFKLTKEEFEQKHQQLVQKLEIEEAEIAHIKKQGDASLRIYIDSFKSIITNENRSLDDSMETLEFHYNKNKQNEGILHLAKCINQWRIPLKLEDTSVEESLDKYKNVPQAIKDRFKNSKVKIVTDNKGGTNKIDAIVKKLRPFCSSFYKYLELKAKYQKLELDNVAPINFAIKKLVDKHHKDYIKEIENVMVKLSPINLKKKGHEFVVFNNDPLYHIFTGKQKVKDGEIPTTLAMDVYQKITNALIHASRIKVKGQRRQPDVFNAIAQILPEILENETASISISSQWYEWKFDFYSIQESFTQILKDRSMNQKIMTECKSLNTISNQIRPDQATLILSMVEHECYVAA
jgi:hypothetical protein